MVKITLDAETFKALASSTRLTVMRALDERRKTLSELARDLDLNKATVHEHLALLTAAELVRKRDDEGRKWIYYELTWRGQKILHPQETTTFNVLLGISVAAAGGGLGMLASALLRWNAERPGPVPESDIGAAGARSGLSGLKTDEPGPRGLADSYSLDSDSTMAATQSASSSAPDGSSDSSSSTSGPSGEPGQAPGGAPSQTYSATGSATATHPADSVAAPTAGPEGADAGAALGFGNHDSNATLDGGSHPAVQHFTLGSDGWLGIVLVAFALMSLLLSVLLYRRLRPAQFAPPADGEADADQPGT